MSFQGVDTFTQLPTPGSGDKMRTWKDTIGANVVHTEVVKKREGETYVAVFDRIVCAQNKILSIFNTLSTKKVRIYRIWLFNWQITAVTGVLLEFELKRITARTAGTSVTPRARDSNNSLTAGITTSHADTAVTESTLLGRPFSANEELVLNTLNTTTIRGFNWDDNLIYDAREETEPEILRQNQGMALKQITNSVVGTYTVVIEFTEENA